MKTKHLLAALAICLSSFMTSFLSAQDCLDANITLTTQDQVTNFVTLYGTCDRITGNLTIGSSSGMNAITDLSGLENITSIGGGLLIRFNAALTTLEGLQNLNTIDGFLIINRNDALTTLEGLQNLNTINGYLQITSNDALTNLEGLQNLNTINGYLQIASNATLTNLEELQNLNTIDGFLSITNNALLNEFCGLHPLLTSETNGITTRDLSGNAIQISEIDIINGGACGRVLPASELPAMPPWQLLLLGVVVLSIGTFSFRKFFETR